MPSLNELIEKIEAAGGPDPELDREVMMAAGYRYEQRDIGCRYEDGSVALDWVYVDTKTDKWRSTHPLEFTASIDAAMTLIPSGWHRSMFDADNGDALCKLERDEQGIHTRGKTWPLALCAAALKARQEDNDNAGGERHG